MGKDWKTTAVGILTLIITVAAAGKAVLTGGLGALDMQGVVQTILGVLVGLGFIKAADAT